MNDQASPGLSTFEERVRAGRFVMTAEIAPPVSADAQDLRAQGVAEVFTPADFDITDIVGRIVDEIRRAHSLEPVPTMEG